jgi:hypothetical protein
MSMNFKIIISTIPFIVISILAIRHYRKIKWRRTIDKKAEPLTAPYPLEQLHVFIYEVHWQQLIVRRQVHIWMQRRMGGCLPRFFRWLWHGHNPYNFIEVIKTTIRSLLVQSQLPNRLIFSS